MTMDGMGDICEGLARSGAGQYFTPRPLVDWIVRLVQPAPGEVIQDPAAGSGGFLIRYRSSSCVKPEVRGRRDRR
jgi:type I restriction enzyme M protein